MPVENLQRALTRKSLRKSSFPRMQVSYCLVDVVTKLRELEMEQEEIEETLRTICATGILRQVSGTIH